MDQPVIRIPTPPQVRKAPRHPKIERVVHEEISQDWADDTSLWSSARSLNQCSILLHHWGRQPSFDVEQRPRARNVFSDGPHQQRVVDIVEQTFDIELQDPIVFPAPLTR